MKSAISLFVTVACTTVMSATWTDPETSYTWTYGSRLDYWEVVNWVSSNDSYIPAISPKPNGFLDIPSFLGGKPVTGIGPNAFSKCDEMTSVAIPSSVAIIEEYAFVGCKGLMCVTIPDSVVSIKRYAFADCSGLIDVAIPESVRNIDDAVFYNCKGIKKVAVPQYVLDMQMSRVFPSANITNVMFTSAITHINGSAFKNCSGLTSMMIPDGVTSIGGYAFDSCYGLTNIIIPSSVTSIKRYSFKYCHGLTSLAIPNSVTSIEEGAFDHCYGITSIVFPDSAKSISPYTFADCYGLTNIAIGCNVVDIGSYAFSNCRGLTSVTIPISVTNIGNYAFNQCSALKDVYLPLELLGKLHSSVFSGCSADLNIRYYGLVSATFDANGGSGGGCVTQEYGSLQTAPDVSRVGYTFTGWSPDVPTTVPATNVTYIAQWEINKHIVTFDANGGTGGTSELRDYGTAINAPVVMCPYGTFKEWLPSVAATVPDHDVTYVAQWDMNKYTMCFDANGGEGGCCVTQEYNTILSAPEVSRSGFAFSGWQPAVPEKVPGSNATYIAQWRVDTHTVTFDANGGSGGWSATRKYGSELVAPIVSRVGYAFVGWVPIVPETVPDEDVTYTARWEPSTYMVMFAPTGGSLNGATENTEVVFDSCYGELPTPTKEYCNFAGWTFNGEVVTPSTVVAAASNHVLVATWSRWGARISRDEIAEGKTLRALYPDDYANLTTIVLDDGIAELPEGFFEDCDNVESLILPESLETIGYGDLPTRIRESIDYDADGFMVYQGWVLGYCDDLAANLTLPQGVVGIGDRALAEFYDLETVIIPDTVRHIGRKAFYEDTFLDNVIIPDSVETIGVSAFENCSWMLTISVGSGVRKIAELSFARCTSLEDLVFHDGLEIVGACAFTNDWRMRSVTLPHSVTNIGRNAFLACKGINGVTIPTDVMTMAELFPATYASVESVVVAAGETDIMDNMFNGCGRLVNFTWAETVTNVGSKAFFGCCSLQSVAIPDSVVQIGSSAFEGCSLVSDLTLSRSLVSLPNCVFKNCTSLDSFVIPASVSWLGSSFVGNSAKALYFLGNAPGYASDAYSSSVPILTNYVEKGTRGWDGTPSSRVLPEKWNNRGITYWTPNRFDVTFDAMGGYFGLSSVTNWSEQQITDNAYNLPNQNPVRPGYMFDGWWTESGSQIKYSSRVTATRAHTLYAHWRFLGNIVMATFNSNGGTVVIPGSQSYVAGQTFGEFPVPSRRGYLFQGWWTAAAGGDRMSESMKVPSADIELFAHWKPIHYFVHYDPNDGAGFMTDSEHVYDRLSSLSQNRFVRTGYAFTGWARNPEGMVEYEECADVVNLAEVTNEIVRLYAVWSGTGYNIRFDSYGGADPNHMEVQTIQIGETKNLHTNRFVYVGCEFIGWSLVAGGPVVYKDGDSVHDLSTVNGETINMYAVWSEPDSSWRVSFNANGGSIAPGYWNVARGESVDAWPTPTRPGFTFEGWWTERVGGVAAMTPFLVAADITLYAHWHDNDDPLPPVSGETGVAAVMGDSADLRLGEKIKTVDEYNSLVSWVDAKGIDHQAIRISTHSWSSYVFGAEALFENEPTIEFGAIGIELHQDAAIAVTGPTIEMMVTVKDGERGVAVDADCVAGMFEATSDLGDWTGAKLPVDVEVVDDGGSSPSHQMRFKATPGGSPSQAFLRIRK